MADIGELVAALPDKTLLLLDDDGPLRTRLGRALEQRGQGQGPDHAVGLQPMPALEPADGGDGLSPPDAVDRPRRVAARGQLLLDVLDLHGQSPSCGTPVSETPAARGVNR